MDGKIKAWDISVPVRGWLSTTFYGTEAQAMAHAEQMDIDDHLALDTGYEYGATYYGDAPEVEPAHFQPDSRLLELWLRVESDHPDFNQGQVAGVCVKSLMGRQPFLALAGYWNANGLLAWVAEAKAFGDLDEAVSWLNGHQYKTGLVYGITISEDGRTATMDVVAQVELIRAGEEDGV